MNRSVLMSGCSGGGKSTLLQELVARGHAVVEEPGRRIVKQELEGDGAALSWVDMVAFGRRAIEMAIADHAAACEQTGWMFFDRGLVDAAAALQHLTGEPILEKLSVAHRCHQTVFLTPPWPEIYTTDPERRHGFDEAVDEYGWPRSIRRSATTSSYCRKSRSQTGRISSSTASLGKRGSSRRDHQGRASRPPSPRAQRLRKTHHWNDCRPPAGVVCSSRQSR